MRRATLFRRLSDSTNPNLASLSTTTDELVSTMDNRAPEAVPDPGEPQGHGPSGSIFISPIR
jgi:hypothetical protein